MQKCILRCNSRNIGNHSKVKLKVFVQKVLRFFVGLKWLRFICDVYDEKLCHLDIQNFYHNGHSNLLLEYRVLLQKLTVAQLVRKFPVLHVNRRFITASTTARHLSLSSARSIKSIQSNIPLLEDTV